MGSNNPVFQFQLSSTPRSGLDSRLDCQLESRVNFGKYFNWSSVTFVHFCSVDVSWGVLPDL